MDFIDQDKHDIERGQWRAGGFARNRASDVSIHRVISVICSCQLEQMLS